VTERIEIEQGLASLVCNVEGTESSIVLLHAGVADRRSWAGVQRVLASTHRTIAYDRRGFGDTRYDREPFSHVSDLAAVVERFGAEGVVLVGNSIGGALAIDFALEHPEKVRALVLVAAAVSGASPLDVDTDQEASIEAEIEAAEADGDLEEVNRLEAWLWLDGGGQAEGRVGGAERALFLDMNRVALNAPDPGPAVDTPPAFDRLHELSIPVLLLVGDLDISYMHELARIMTERLPHARSMRIPGLAHLPQMEQPELIAGLIAGFGWNLDRG
jgi:pimeloyl-ACP methyl ester carboxylesterase